MLHPPFFHRPFRRILNYIGLYVFHGRTDKARAMLPSGRRIEKLAPYGLAQLFLHRL